MMKVLHVLVCVSLVTSQVALASKKPLPGPVVAKAPVPTALELTPATLRHQLLETNLSVTQTLNQVKDAKDQVSVARGNLLPSLNLGAMLNGGGASFLLSSVSFLLPFLMPSNWFNFRASKNNFEAEKLTYLILELNLYSSALSLFVTLNSDQEVQQAYEAEAKDLQQFADIYAKEVQLGIASPTDILALDAQAKLTALSASQLAQLVKQELASMRQVLGLPLSTKITLKDVNLNETVWETKNIQDAINQANTIAPEHQQIIYLVKNAEAKKWSTVFSFINGTSLSSTSNGNGSANMSALTLSTGVNLGFGLFPQIKLSNRNIQEVKLLETQLIQSNTQLLESSIQSMTEARAQYDYAAGAEKQYLALYHQQEKEYQLGTATTADVLYSRTQVTAATVARIRATLNLNLQRTVIDRTMVADEFAKIKGCKAQSNEGKDKRKVSLDQLCKEAAGSTM